VKASTIGNARNIQFILNGKVILLLSVSPRICSKTPPNKFALVENKIKRLSPIPVPYSPISPEIVTKYR
jgi:hypothetical protein